MSHQIQFILMRFQCILFNSHSYVYHYYESIYMLCEILEITVKYMVSSKVLQRGLQNQSGNIFVNAFKILHVNDTCAIEDVCLVLVLLHLYQIVLKQITFFKSNKV